MKRFCEMTSNEIREYNRTKDGVWSYRIEAFNPRTGKTTWHDGDETSEENRMKTIREILGEHNAKGHKAAVRELFFRSFPASYKQQ